MAPATTSPTSTSCQSTGRPSNEQPTHLVDDQGAEVSQDRHVGKREQGPAPAPRFAANHRQRGSALAAQGEEDHQRQGRGDREHLLAGVVLPRGVLQCPTQLALGNQRLGDILARFLNYHTLRAAHLASWAYG